MDTPPVPTNTTPHQAFLALPRAWTRVGPALARSCIPEGSQITASKDKDNCPLVPEVLDCSHGGDSE